MTVKPAGMAPHSWSLRDVVDQWDNELARLKSEATAGSSTTTPPRSKPAYPPSTRTSISIDRIEVASTLPGPPSGDASPAQTDHPAKLTEEIHAELIKAGWGRYCAIDDKAYVLNAAPFGEALQNRLVRMTIETADRFAAITTYEIDPTTGSAPGQMSGTTFAMLESLARRQSDKDFDFVFLYNRNKLRDTRWLAARVGLKPGTRVELSTQPRKRSGLTWPQVVEAYNREQTDPALKLTDIRCGIYFVENRAKGLAGSQHNKFCINDRGVAATLGASIGNRTKTHWLDSGCVTLSRKLASSQRDYLVDEMVGKSVVRCGQLKTDSSGKPAMDKLPDDAEIRRMRKVPVSSPLEGSAAEQENFWTKAAAAGIPREGAAQKVLWIQNPPNGFRNMHTARGRMDVTPIGHALSSVLKKAGAGDTLKMAHNFLRDDALRHVKGALEARSDVKVLLEVPRRDEIESSVRKAFPKNKPAPTGTLTTRDLQMTPALAQACGMTMRGELKADQYRVHSKAYILERSDGSKVVMTGTYNLDGQSAYRSAENMMLFETTSHPLPQLLFDLAFDGCADLSTTRTLTPGGKGKGKADE